MIVPTLEFRYHNGDGTATYYKVRPLRVYHQGKWYLKAYCLTTHQDLDFRFDRMDHITESTTQRNMDDPHEFRTSAP